VDRTLGACEWNAKDSRADTTTVAGVPGLQCTIRRSSQIGQGKAVWVILSVSFQLKIIAVFELDFAVAGISHLHIGADIDINFIAAVFQVR
jgi:hypothetical protein